MTSCLRPDSIRSCPPPPWTRSVAHWRALLAGALIWLLATMNAAAEPSAAQRLVVAARGQVGVTVGYDGSYRRLSYPNGDVPMATGVCTDVVIRAMRGIGVDLQREVHEDRKRHPERYVKRASRIDRNIDHRRVPNLRVWFASHAEALSPSADATDFKPGDIVSWKLPGGLDHIGIVSDRRVAARPLILHNISRGTQEEDVLFAWTMTGHYRLR